MSQKDIEWPVLTHPPPVRRTVCQDTLPWIISVSLGRIFACDFWAAFAAMFFASHFRAASDH